jgi:methylated-DNA-protein-cysteine methyltransferase related protein
MSQQPLDRTGAGRLAAQVYALVLACPPGRVTTYGWLAKAIGYPRGARMVGWFMNHTPKDNQVPAQRVINSKGELTGSWAFGQRGRMQHLLEAEGIEFAGEGKVDLKRYGWDPNRDLTPDALAAILSGADAAAPVAVDDDLMAQLLDDPASPFRISPAEE